MYLPVLGRTMKGRDGLQGNPETRGQYVLIVLDGLGDLPHPSLQGNTPLGAATTPHLDALAQRSELGLLDPVRKGVAPESDAGVLGLLGYDPEQESPGRGVLEAMGISLDLRPGDVALRFNFATTDASGKIVDQRVGRNLATEEAAALAEALTQARLLESEGIEATVSATVGHRGVLRLTSLTPEELSPDVTNSDPFYERAGRAGHAVKPKEPRVKEVLPQNSTPSAVRTSRALNLFSARVANLLPEQEVNHFRKARGALVANNLIVRDAGTLPQGLPSFAARHGLHGAAVTEMPVERGIALLLGLADVFVGPMGKDVPGALRHRAEMVRRELDQEHRPFVYVHLKGPDEPGHDGDALRKKQIVEDLDQHFMGPFLDGLDLSRVTVAVTADHSTPCVLRGHSDDPVPLLVSTRGKVQDPSKNVRYTEDFAWKGTLGEHLGKELLPYLLRGEWPTSG